jgi:hypothetical protein
VLGSKRGCWPVPRPPGLPSKARRFHLRPARGARRHRAHPHQPGNAGAALQGDRLDLWSDEPGFEEAIAQTGVTGICGSGIIEAIAEMYLAGVISQDGLSMARWRERSPHASSPTSAPSTM